MVQGVMNRNVESNWDSEQSKGFRGYKVTNKQRRRWHGRWEGLLS